MKTAEVKKESIIKKETELKNPVFPKELMRRRWSQKDIIAMLCKEINNPNSFLILNLKKVFKT